jgi:hypothetical protein
MLKFHLPGGQVDRLIAAPAFVDPGVVGFLQQLLS